MNGLLARVLTDENIHPQIIEWLRARGSDVVTAHDAGLNGKPDTVILEAALATSRTVLTHDRDFGQLAILNRQKCTSIVYLRPGHVSADHAVRALAYIESLPDATMHLPVIVVARVVDDRVVVRTRPIAS